MKNVDACLLELPFFEDQRGSFFKSFSEEQFKKSTGIDFSPRENFFSISHKGVLRGFHFQAPPADHDKIVFCLGGKTLDVVVDLRHKNGTFGKVQSFELNAGTGKAVFVPKGFGHAFLAMEEGTIVGYLVTSVHAHSKDLGIHWSSVNFDWPIRNPIVSERDNKFPRLQDFSSPF